MLSTSIQNLLATDQADFELSTAAAFLVKQGGVVA